MTFVIAGIQLSITRAAQPDPPPETPAERELRWQRIMDRVESVRCEAWSKAGLDVWRNYLR